MNQVQPSIELVNAFLQSELLRQQKVEFKTNFNFLKAHNGFRRGKLHTLMGISHGGKSTMIRSIIDDTVSNNPDIKIGLWLSEESVVDCQLEFFKNSKDIGKYKNVDIQSEKTMEYDEYKIMEEFKRFCERGFDIIVFDNITTSVFYMDKTNERQSGVAHGLKRLAEKTGIALLVIAHTGSKVTSNIDRVITQQDLRGNKSICNLTEFFYTLQTVTVGSTTKTYVIIEKHRGQNVTEKIYQTIYNPEKAIVTGDKQVNFEAFKDFFKVRNKL